MGTSLLHVLFPSTTLHNPLAYFPSQASSLSSFSSPVLGVCVCARALVHGVQVHMGNWGDKVVDSTFFFFKIL